MARLYANENFPLPTVDGLRTLGHDVLTTQDAGRAGMALPDDSVLAFSVAEGRILLTLNRKHFIRLHRARPDHKGIVVCTFDPDFAALAQRIHTALATTHRTWTGNLRINRPANKDAACLRVALACRRRCGGGARRMTDLAVLHAGPSGASARV
jgi:hypothetical protein